METSKLLTEVAGLEIEVLNNELTFRLDGDSESIAVTDKEAAWLTRAFGLRDKPGYNLLEKVMEIVDSHRDKVAVVGQGS